MTELSRFTTLDVEEYQASTAIELARRVADGSLSPVQLAECALHIAGDAEPVINAYAALLPERALREAAELEAAARSGRIRGPLHGVPIAVKDNFYYEGEPTWKGSLTSSDEPARVSAPMVARLTAAGAVVIGKATTPEFGWKGTGISPRTGVTRNPWDPSMGSGGSSAGSAATVASGAVPAAIGTDGGGSIRIPAACCGLVGLKPTRGRNSLGPWVGDIMNGLVAEHVVSRSVRDTAAALDATAGYVAGDPYAAFPPTRPYLSELAGGPRKLRIGYSTATPYGNPLDAEIAAATEATAKLCAALGHEVEEASFDVEARTLLPAFFAVYGAGLASTIDTLAQLTSRAPRAGDFEAMTWNAYQAGRAVTASQYLIAVGALQRSGRAFAAFFEDRDIWLTPSLGALPLPVGLINVDDANATLADPRIAAFAHYNPVYNVSGQPAISLPLQVSKSGLPIGMLFGARYGEEATLLHLAAQLETAQPWHGRRPLID
jgi:amidase